ncbi:MAG: TM2 domain-containing protein [Rhodobacteraceae bacterium]|nr:TM2 domain-containing protein [Paracoccaceae bacterium]
MTLSVQQQMLVEQRVVNEGKSTLAAYLLAIFLGGLGVHRFYLGRTGSGIAMLILNLFAWLMFAIAIVGLIVSVEGESAEPSEWLALPLIVGALLLVGVGIWLLVDLFLIPGIIEADRRALRARITLEIGAAGRTRAAG